MTQEVSQEVTWAPLQHWLIIEENLQYTPAPSLTGACWLSDLVVCSKLSCLWQFWLQEISPQTPKSSSMFKLCWCTVFTLIHSLIKLGTEFKTQFFVRSFFFSSVCHTLFHLLDLGLGFSHILSSLPMFAALSSLFLHISACFIDWPFLLLVPVSFSQFCIMSFISVNLEPAHKGECIACRHCSLYSYTVGTNIHQGTHITQSPLPWSSVTVFVLMALMVLFDLNSCD